MFDLDHLIAECRQAATAREPQPLVHAILARAVDDSAAALEALEDRGPGLHALYRSDGLTILNVVWAAHMSVGPHDHRMWAVIGMYAGCEENTFWRADAQGRLKEVGRATLRPGEVRSLGRDVIHSVHNPLERLTGALHVYGGDFFQPAGRSEWNEHGLQRQGWDPARAAERFRTAAEAAPQRW
ncbi:MAG TPA: hypothetical protein VGF26_07100 [Ramlibacter sp.]